MRPANVTFKLGTTYVLSWVEFTIDGSTVRFTCAASNNFAARQFKLGADSANNLFLCIKHYIDNNNSTSGTALDLLYAIDLTPVTYGSNNSAAKVRISAREYLPAYNFVVAAIFNQPVPGSGAGYDPIVLESKYNTIGKPIIDFTVQQATCFGSATGSIQVGVSGGVPGYAYAWQDGPSTQNRTNLAASTYHLIVTDNDETDAAKMQQPGTDEKTIIVGQNSLIQITTTIVGNNINANVSGGVGPYTFSWVGPAGFTATTANLVNVAPGNYTLTVTDSYGCQRSRSVTIQAVKYHFSRNAIPLRLHAVNIHTKPNLTFVAEIQVETEYGSNVFTTQAILQAAPDSSNGVTFDLAPVLDTFVEPHIPAFNQALPSRAHRAFKRFRVKHYEKFGTPAVAGPSVTTSPEYVICGGLDFYEFSANTWFSSWQPDVRPFFTWDPKTKHVLPNQPEYLYFQSLHDSITSLEIKVRVYPRGGQAYTFQAYAAHGIRKHELWVLPVGYAQLNLGILTGIIDRYEVWVTDQQNIIRSETRNFKVDWNYYPNVRYFLYANSIGGVNTLATTGQTELALDTEQTLAEAHKPWDYDYQLGETKVAHKRAQPTLKVPTGPKSKEYYTRLQDFIISEHVREHTGAGYRVGYVKTDNYNLDEADARHAFTFEFVPANLARYTPELRLAVYTEPVYTEPEPTFPGSGEA